MTQFRIGARVLLLLAMVVSGFLGSMGLGASAAQTGTTFVSPMTGIPITTAGPWTLDPASVMSQDGIESVTIEGEFEFMQVWFMPGNVNLVEARDVVLDSFAQTFGTFVEIDRGAYGNVSYSLDITSSEGIEFGVFSLFLGQRDSGYVEYYVYFGALSLFAQGFASAQQNVTVNGTGIFGGVDGVGLQNLLLANAGVTGTSTTTTTQAPPVPTAQPQQPNQPNAPTQPTPPPATEGGPASNDGAIYLESLKGETAYLQTTIDDFLTNYMLMDSNAEAAVPELDRVAEAWRAYPQRAAGITAPAGFETLDASYRAVATEAEALAGLWDGVLQSAQAQDGTTGTKIADLVLRVMSFQVMIDDLNTAISTAGGTATTTTTEQPTQAPADAPVQPTQAPADTPAQPTGGLNAEQMAYLQSVRTEIDSLESSIVEFLDLFGQFSDGTNSDQAIAGIQTIMSTWSTYPDTAATLVAPAGMEDVGTQYQAIANAFPTAASTFQSAMEAGAAGDQATLTQQLDSFSTQLETLFNDIGTLRGLIDQYESAGASTTTTTTEPTEAPVDTPAQPTAEAQPTQESTTTTTTTSPDGDAYVASISGETQAIMDSIVLFAEGLQLLGSTDTAEQDQGVTNINEAVAYWQGYEQVAAGIVAPAGFEDVDAAYRQLATDVTGLSTLFNAWLDAPEASKQAAGDEFSAAFDNVQTQIENLNAMIGGGTTTSTGQADVPADITETGNRGQLPEIPTQGDDPQGTGTANAEELGLVSETEYVSPQYNLQIVWDEGWAFDGEAIDNAIGSDEASGQDWISLVWADGDGVVTITFSEEGDYDVEALVAEWESDDYLDSRGLSGEVLLADASNDRGGVLVLLDDDTVFYQEAVCLSRACDEVAIVEVSASVMDATDLIADAEEGIEIEGEGATGVFSTREINRVLDQ